ncbi:MAG: hypothetical protein WA461_00650 [Nitrososphaeraceae archaeon]
MMLPDIKMRINTGPEDFIEVDLEAGLKSPPVDEDTLSSISRATLW